LQINKVTNEDKGVKTLLQNIVMEEVQYEEEEVYGLQDKGSAPFLTRATYQEELSRGTIYQFVVAAEQQVDQQKQVAANSFILVESKLEANPSSHGYADLQISQPAFFPCPVINKGVISSPSSFLPLPNQRTIPQSFPLNTEAKQNSILKTQTNHLSLDILMPTEDFSTQIEMATC